MENKKINFYVQTEFAKFFSKSGILNLNSLDVNFEDNYILSTISISAGDENV